MRLALAQLNYTIGAFDGTFEKMDAAVSRADTAGADLVIFTESATTGYPARDLLDRPRFIDLNLELLDRVARRSTPRLGILVGFVDRNPAPEGKRLFNAAALCHEGRVVARRYKSLLPTYDVFDEGRYFEPAGSVSPVEFRGWRLGLTICEDVWNDRDFWPTRIYHRDPVAELVAQGVDVLINISASPYAFAKADLRRRMIRQEAVKHRRPFIYVNQIGGNDELVFDGHSIAIDAEGRDLVRARDFAEDFIVIDLGLPGHASTRSAAPVLRDVSMSADEEAFHALVIGLRDYVGKCGFSRVVIGLSGGIDSALTACLAVEALGADRVTGIAMPTRYSSQASVDDAKALAAALGIACRVVPIDGMLAAVAGGIVPALDGCPTGTTEENLQARLRGNVLMAFSNQTGALVLSTGNKSELAVGYCTLYGDMCGGLAVLSDVPKLLVYRLSALINRRRPVIPESTMTKPPSAELRPNQKDTDSLPPYEVLDPIIEAYVERGLDVNAIAELGFDRAVVADVVKKIDSSEYKRRQAAPGLKLSAKAFGVGRRYPIAAEYSKLRG